MTLALVGKLTLASAYQTMYLHTSELFPTEVRTWGMGNTNMLARIGSVFASFLVSAIVSPPWVWVWAWGHVVLEK